MFDFNKLDKYREAMNEFSLDTLVFKQEPRLQFGETGEDVYYIDIFSEEQNEFVPVIESDNWEEFKLKVANYFLEEDR